MLNITKEELFDEIHDIVMDSVNDALDFKYGRDSDMQYAKEADSKITELLDRIYENILILIDNGGIE